MNTIKQVILADRPRYSDDRYTLLHETAPGSDVYVFQSDLTDPGAGYGLGVGEYTLEQLTAIVEEDNDERRMSGENSLTDDWNGGSSALITDPGEVDDLIVWAKEAE